MLCRRHFHEWFCTCCHLSERKVDARSCEAVWQLVQNYLAWQQRYFLRFAWYLPRDKWQCDIVKRYAKSCIICDYLQWCGLFIVTAMICRNKCNRLSIGATFEIPAFEISHRILFYLREQHNYEYRISRGSENIQKLPLYNVLIERRQLLFWLLSVNIKAHIHNFADALCIVSDIGVTVNGVL